MCVTLLTCAHKCVCVCARTFENLIEYLIFIFIFVASKFFFFVLTFSDAILISDPSNSTKKTIEKGGQKELFEGAKGDGQDIPRIESAHLKSFPGLDAMEQVEIMKTKSLLSLADTKENVKYC